MFDDLKEKYSVDGIKGRIKDALQDKPNSSGQWVDGKFVPNAQQEPQQYQQPVQQPIPEQYQQPMQQPTQQPQQYQPQQYQQQQYQQPPYQQYQQPQYQQPVQPVEPQSGLACPKCKSHNVNVQLVETGSKTKTKKSGVGLGGHAHNAARAGVAFMTLGASNLVIKKATGTEKGKTKTKNETYCICQNCGHSWKKK